MSLKISVLALERLNTTTSGRTLYKAEVSPTAKSALVKVQRFTNVAASGAVKLNVYFVPSGGTYSTTGRRILPKDQVLPAGCAIIDDVELTLGPGDSLYAVADVAGLSNPAPAGDWVDFVVSGLEKIN